MKLFKLMPILSLAFALTLSMVAMAVLGSPVGAEDYDVTRVTEVTEYQTESTEPNVDAIYGVLMANRLFGGDLFNDEALVEEAQVVLLDQIEIQDGMSVIKRDTVNRFIKELYGREIKNSFDGDYYVVGARGYDPIGHEVTDISADENGKVTVRSTMYIGASDPVNVVTVLSPSQNRFGYMILSADIVE